MVTDNITINVRISLSAAVQYLNFGIPKFSPNIGELHMSDITATPRLDVNQTHLQKVESHKLCS